MDYSNAAAAAVLQSIGTPETETTESSAIAALESALQQNRAPVAHALHNSLNVANNKRNGTEVTRLLVDAVTVSTANTEREHCFLPSHKGSPYHVHKLAERVLPAELLQGPKSYNDALAKRFERKKGDMGSSSTGVKDRGIFVAADFRNPRTDQELQEMRVLLEPMSIMFSSKGYKVDDVVQEVRRMQSGWQHSDYRAWLKHYTTGKRPRSVLEDSKQLLRHDGGDDGAGAREMGTGTDSEPVGGNSGGSGLPPMPGMETTDGPNLAAQMQDAMHNMSGVPAQQLAGQPQNAQQFPVPLPYMLHPGSLMQISPGQHGEVPEGSNLPVGAVNEVGSVASANANLLKLFAAACQHKGLITRTQRAEMADFVQQMYMDRLAQ
ncbi:TPA: hypothetical protein ACH3X2_003908 [Trebouxia sp. C0005]